jgi:hypothetical protein
MSHESRTLEEVLRRACQMVGNFKADDVDKVPMQPTQGFEPLVSVIVSTFVYFVCFWILLT